MSNIGHLSKRGWKECKLGEVIEIVGGGTPKTHIPDYWNGSIPWLSVVDFNSARKYVYKTEKTITQKGLNNSSAKLLNEGDIIVSARGTVGALAVLRKQMAFNQSCYGVRGIPGISNQDYVYYLIKDSINSLQQIAHGGVFDTITRETFDHIVIVLPSISEQRVIARVLSSLDDKIDLLHRQNITLESLAENLWRKMFVEEARSDWIKRSLGDFFQVRTGKKDANYSTEDGSYPFFTCSQDILHSPGYSFEGHAILLAGNCDFNLKRYKGKFEAYQRTYVLIPHNEIFVGFLYYGMKLYLDDITMGHRGSVINFITKGMIESFQLSIIPDENKFNKVCIWFNETNEKIDSNISQIRTLSHLRDTLLPKLMSGE